MHRPIASGGGRGAFPALCFRCRDYIEKGQAAERRDERRKGFEEFNLPQGQAWPLHYPSSDEIVKAHILMLRAALAEALTSLAEPALNQEGYSGDIFHYLPQHDHHNHWARVLISITAAEKIRALHSTLQQAVDEIYKAGRSSGQNLLKQLATMQISMEDFDSVERPSAPTTGKKKRR